MLELAENPVIAAVRSAGDWEAALSCPCRVLFALNADILTIEEYAARAKACGKKTFVHADLMEGIGKDSAGIGYLKRIGADGVISTRSGIVRLAKDWGLSTVQRFFIVDSHSVDTAVESAKASCPDLCELMPGIIGRTISAFVAAVKTPVIAGGLVQTKQDVIAALSAGASAVSTAKRELWYE